MLIGKLDASPRESPTAFAMSPPGTPGQRDPPATLVRFMRRAEFGRENGFELCKACRACFHVGQKG